VLPDVWVSRLLGPCKRPLLAHKRVEPVSELDRAKTADAIDEALPEYRVQPRSRRALVLGDIAVCKAVGKNDKETYPANPDLPWSGGSVFR